MVNIKAKAKTILLTRFIVKFLPDRHCNSLRSVVSKYYDTGRMRSCVWQVTVCGEQLIRSHKCLLRNILSRVCPANGWLAVLIAHNASKYNSSSDCEMRQHVDRFYLHARRRIAINGTAEYCSSFFNGVVDVATLGHVQIDYVHCKGIKTKFHWTSQSKIAGGFESCHYEIIWSIF